MSSISRETLKYQIEAQNINDEFSVAFTKKGKVIWHLMNGKSGKLVKTVTNVVNGECKKLYFFLRADTVNSPELKIKGKPVSDGKGMSTMPNRIY